MKKTNIGILTFPISEAGTIPLSNLVDILRPSSKDIYLITGNKGYDLFKGDGSIHVYGIKHEQKRNIFRRIVRYIHTQLKISYKLIKISRNVDIWIFFIGSERLFLPIVTAKLLNKKIILLPADFIPMFSKKVTSHILEIITRFNHALSNKIILHSPNLIKEWNLERYIKKISIANEYFLDFDNFKIQKNFDARVDLIGYIGRLSEEKGVLNLVKASTEILKEGRVTKVILGGDGHLRDEIQRYLEKNNLNKKIELVGWIPHNKVSDYLNELKLLVIPSYTESGPIVALEAMACGTPILITPVGHISNIIKDGETGFIMVDNSPECIAENVIRALKQPNLSEITKNARKLIEREYTYESAVERYTKILEEFDPY